MKAMAILPAFLPIDDIKASTGQVLPDLEVRTDTDFERSEADVLVVTTFTRVDSELLGKFPSLKFLQVASTGYDNVDLDAVRNQGVMLSNIPVANKESVAEHVIAMVLSLLKDMRFLDNELRNGNWPMITGSRELKGKTFGIVGMGAIGIRLAERLLPFEVGMVYHDVRRLPEEREQNLGLTYLPFERLLEVSDVISIHVPLTKETERMFSSSAFGKMKDGAILINTSRGEVVDEQALIAAVKGKGIRAGLDVFPAEPPDFSSELFRLDNVIFSPHIAGVTVESQQRFITETVSNVLRYAQGVDPLYRVQL
ncbi:MAG: 2-hydroxyacid dehydrogenase [Candidatus Thermoplasmatota archaeon]|jgi:D-3-phosphoglycerate dehydrogenase|nr:2-hydroxyacid dehydrogenase [Candidatus Thermoplasmatota archaeon]